MVKELVALPIHEVLLLKSSLIPSFSFIWLCFSQELFFSSDQIFFFVVS
jgi:hypothetical protein